MGLAHFSIGTATDRIDLLRNVRVADWEPSETPIEDTFASSALAEGRQLASHRYLNAVESMTLHIFAPSQDKVIEWSQELRRMLSRARDYWDTEHQPEIVYVMARASCETNMRYAWIHRGNVPKDSDPHGQHFVGRSAPRFWDREFVFERGAWQDNAPGVGTAVLTEGSQSWCFPSFLEFDGVDDFLDCASDAKLDNLPDNGVSGKGPITVEAWIRADSWGENNNARVAQKGWNMYLGPVAGLGGYIPCAAVSASSQSGIDEFTVDGEWHHVLMTYSETGAGLPAMRIIYLAIDGVWVTSYPAQVASVAAYTLDAADILYVGNRAANDRTFEGGIGWVRVSDSIRYTPGGGNFTPLDRCLVPDIDANTMGQWVKEGQDTAGAIPNQSGGTDATITGATWDCDCPTTYGYVPPPGGTAATGWWDPLDEGLCVWGAWQARDAASFAASLVDLTGNGNDLGDPGGANTPGWDAVNGWIFDGINDYLTTTFVPQNDQSQAMLCQFANWVDIAGNNYLAGSYTIANTYFTIAPDNGNIVFCGNGQNRWYFGVSFNSGNLGVSGGLGYKNGTSLVGGIGLYTALPTQGVYVGCFNNNGVAAGFAQVNMQRMVIYDCSLTAPQMQAVWAAMTSW